MNCSSARVNDDKMPVPVCFALLPDKTSATYDRMMEEIMKVVNLKPGVPARFMADFEMGFWNSISKHLPWAKVIYAVH
jgi:hypothetical protein